MATGLKGFNKEVCFDEGERGGGRGREEREREREREHMFIKLQRLCDLVLFSAVSKCYKEAYI